MQMKWMAPSTLDRRHVRENGLEKVLEFGRGHLAGGHLELAVLDRAEASDMAIDRDIVWRVRKYQPRLFAIHQVVIGRRIAGIGAKQSVVTEVPEVAEP